jgi:hypothetical protein
LEFELTANMAGTVQEEETATEVETP